MNSIAMYCMSQLLKGWVGERLKMHLMPGWFEGTYGPIIQSAAVLLVLWLVWMTLGGITVSDVQLALTSPEDTLILGFNAVPDDAARALAEERGVQIRQYAIIYQLTDDLRAALEGKLKPREEVVHLGRAVVRQTFKISRVGTVAGCYVTQGTIERNAKVRVIRGGVVVYPPADRTASLESLKHHKDDVREVKQAFECGIKIAGYDDIKVDDVIEAYRIEQVQRTLS